MIFDGVACHSKFLFLIREEYRYKTQPNEPRVRSVDKIDGQDVENVYELVENVIPPRVEKRHIEVIRVQEMPDKAKSVELPLGSTLFLAYEYLTDKETKIDGESIQNWFIHSILKSEAEGSGATQRWIEFIALCSKYDKLCDIDMMSAYCGKTGEKENRIKRKVNNIERDGIAIKETAYQINNFQDLAYVTLSVGFNANHPIKTCAYCGKLFFPQKRNSEKYCARLNEKERSCKVCARAQQQAQREKKEFPTAKRLRKSRRAIWYKSSKVESDDLLNQDSEKYRSLKKGDITEDAYITWLKGFYKQKGKRI